MHNLAFVALLAGLLLLYCEFIWVGKIYFGIVGSLLLLVSLVDLLHPPRTRFGLALIALAILCFALEAVFQTCRIAGLAASLLLGWGAWKLYPGPITIPPELAFPASAIFGLITLALLSISKQARHNKRSDL